MIKYSEPYVIAFPAGAAGRFVQYLLYNLLTDEQDELETTPSVNSSHPSNRYTGHTCLNTNDPDVWNSFVFDINPKRFAPKIMHSHIFPNFSLIRDRLGPAVKIIIITVDLDSILEVTINDKVKNYHDLVQGIWPKPNVEKEFYENQMFQMNMQYERFLGKPFPGVFVLDDTIQLGKNMAFEVMKYLTKSLSGVALGAPVESFEYEERLKNFVFLPNEIDYPKEQILILPFNELFSHGDDGKFVWLNKLEAFTNKQADAVTIDGYQKYIDGRNALTAQYRIYNESKHNRK
jgi:hypothetical protein